MVTAQCVPPLWSLFTCVCFSLSSLVACGGSRVHVSEDPTLLCTAVSLDVFIVSISAETVQLNQYTRPFRKAVNTVDTGRLYFILVVIRLRANSQLYGSVSVITSSVNCESACVTH